MKKLLYLGIFLFDDKRESGVINKMKGQVKAFRNKGLDVFFTAVYEKKITINNRSTETVIAKNPGNRAILRYFLYTGVKKWLKNNPVDICYIRYAYCDPFFLNLLGFMKRQGTKIVIEVATYPYEEEMNYWPVFQKLIGKTVEYTLNKRIKRNISLVTTYMPADEIFGVRVLEIENGVELDNIKRWKPGKEDDDLHFIGVSSMHTWHGYDRAIRGLADYYANNPDIKVYLHLVGDGVMRFEWEELARRLDLKDYVIFHGTRVNEELDILFDKCDIAIGCLGIYRKKTVRASTLKNKEYCARGIPFVFACEEKYLHDGLDFVKVLPDNDKNISIDGIVQFCHIIKQKSGLSCIMREYAREHFLWDTQIDLILEALSQERKHNAGRRL